MLLIVWRVPNLHSQMFPFLKLLRDNSRRKTITSDCSITQLFINGSMNYSKMSGFIRDIQKIIFIGISQQTQSKNSLIALMIQLAKHAFRKDWKIIAIWVFSPLPTKVNSFQVWGTLFQIQFLKLEEILLMKSKKNLICGKCHLLNHRKNKMKLKLKPDNNKLRKSKQNG